MSEQPRRSPRREQAIALFEQGLTMKEVAREMGISHHTVAVHLKLARKRRAADPTADPRVAALVQAATEARSGLCAYTGGPDGSCEMTIRKIDAALGAFGRT